MRGGTRGGVQPTVQNPVPVGEAMPLAFVVRAAAELSAALAQWHEREGLHAALCPQAVVLDESGGAGLVRPDVGLPALLPYAAPELLGRVWRGADERADLYSLGALVYHLATGQPPSAVPAPQYRDGLAGTAPLVAHLPAVLDDILRQLLAPLPEDRYRSAAGLAADLSRCQQTLSDNRIEPFLLGGRDIRTRPVFSGRLYGRKDRLAKLNAAYDRVSHGGGLELACVIADPGLGKTALLGAFTDGLILDGCRVGRTPFSAMDPVPYGGVARLLTDLADQLQLTGGAQRWRDQLSTAVGRVRDPLVALAPALADLVGGASDAGAGTGGPLGGGTNGAAARNRLHLAVRRLFCALAEPGHPLVLALDDAQWADPASLELLRYVLTDPRSTNLLVVLAYRQRDVAPGPHPLTDLVHAAGATGAAADRRVTASSVLLRPLADAALAELLADTLSAGQRDSVELARVVAEKTRSNSLAVLEFLRRMHAEQHLVRSPVGPAWHWEIEKFARAAGLEDVTAAAHARIGRYPPGLRRLVQIAALLGDAFDAASLAAAAGQSAAQLQTQVRRAVRDDLLTVVAVPGSAGRTGYAWTHETIRRAALSAVPATLRRQRLGIARALCPGGPDAAPDGWAADGCLRIAAHYTGAAALLASEQDRAELAQAQYLAGRFAARLGALDAAGAYLRAAFTALHPQAWLHHRELARAVYTDFATVVADAGGYAEAAQVVDSALRHGGGDVSDVALLRLRAQLYRATGDDDHGYECTVRALELLGISVLAGSDPAMAVEQRLADLDVDALAGAPPTDDPRVVLAAEIVVDPLALPLLGTERAARLTATGVALALEHGPAPASAVAYGHHAVALADRVDPTGRGGWAGQHGAARSAGVAFRLLQTVPAPANAVRLAPVVWLLRSFWYESETAALDRLDEMYRAAVEDGELRRAGAISALQLAHRFVTGVALPSLADGIAEVWRMVARHGADDPTRVVIRAVGEAVSRLRGVACPAPPASPAEVALTVRVEAGAAGYLSTVALTVLQATSYLLGEHSRAVELARAAAGAVGGRGSFLAAVADFFGALSFAACHDPAAAAQQPGLLADFESCRVRLDEWANQGPVPFGAAALLVSAEQGRLDGHVGSATARYERATEAAREHSSPAIEGLAAELGGGYALARGDTAAAVAYLRRARACYERWQAAALVTRVEELLAAAAAPAQSTRAVDELDLIAVIRTFQMISAELSLDRLVVTLLTLFVQSARAEYGALLVTGAAGGLRLAAVATPDRGQLSVVPDPAAPLAELVPVSIVKEVRRTRWPVRGALGELPAELAADPYLLRHQPRALLCAAVSRDDRLLAVLYLEHRRSPASFGLQYLQLLEVMCSQAAIALDNATVHARLLEANRILDAAFDQLPVALILLGPDLTVRRASPLAVEITGLPIRPGTPLVELFDVLTPTDASGLPWRVEPGFARVGGAEPIHRDIAIISPNGQRRMLRTTAIPLRDEASVLVGVTLLVAAAS